MLAQIDFLSGPARPHRRRRRYQTGIRIKSAQRIGLPALGAVGVEQQDRENPRERDCRRPRSLAGHRRRQLDLEQDLGNPPAMRAVRRRENPSCRRNFLICCGADRTRQAAATFGIANPEQRAGARRFQHHLVAAPPQIGEPRQHDHFGSRRALALAANNPATCGSMTTWSLSPARPSASGIPTDRAGPVAGPADRFPCRPRCRPTQTS